MRILKAGGNAADAAVAVAAALNGGSACVVLRGAPCAKLPTPPDLGFTCPCPHARVTVTEPTSTGIGGDCFCLFYDAKRKTVR